jgi:outer membrane protein TolC
MNGFRYALGLHRLVTGLLVATCLQAAGQVASPITLDEVIASAKLHHPQVATAQAAALRADASLRSAHADQLPTLTASEDVLYSNDPVFAFGSKLRQARFGSSDLDVNTLDHPAPLSNFSASLTAQWTAFDAGTARHRLAGASTAVRAAELRTQYSEEQVADQVTTLYYRVLMAEDQIAVVDSAEKRARELAADLHDRVKAGLSLESDGARAQLALQEAQNEVATAHEHVALARTELFETVGMPDSDRPLARPGASELPVALASTAIATVTRPDLQALALDQEAAQQQLASIRASVWPQVTLFGHVENDAQYLAVNGNGNWTIGAKIQISVFDGGARAAREHAALADMHQAAAAERSTRMEAETRVAALRMQLADLHRRLLTAEDAIHVQQETLETAHDRYVSGLATMTEVLSGEDALTAAAFQKVRLSYQLSITEAELSFTLGHANNSKAGRP